jgi:hypothetical protein
MTIQEAAQVALDCQDACNLSGVLRLFGEIVSEVIWPEARRLNQGTEFVNSHPICTLFLDKLTQLNHFSEHSRAYSKAWDEVKTLAKR